MPAKRDAPTKNISFAIFCGLALTLVLMIGCLIVWKAIDLFLLAFAAVLLSILLNAITIALCNRYKIPYWVALTSVLIGLIVFLTLCFWLAAPLISEQAKALVEQVSIDYELLKTKAASYIDLDFLSKEKITNQFFLSEKVLNQAGTIFSFTVGTITSFIVFVFVGLYIAYSPHQYVVGFLALFPPKNRRYVEHTMFNLGFALRWWIFGKLISMVIMGVLTFLGLWILKVPLAFILGLLAALLAFIPYIGAILAAIPAILIALAQSPLKALYVIVLYLLIHALDGYFISPYIDQKTVSLPPALTIITQILLTILIGFSGLALASPLTVVAVVLMQTLYEKKTAPKRLL